MLSNGMAHSFYSGLLLSLLLDDSLPHEDSINGGGSFGCFVSIPQGDSLVLMFLLGLMVHSVSLFLSITVIFNRSRI